jgi:cytochrome c oxidase subunit 2
MKNLWLFIVAVIFIIVGFIGLILFSGSGHDIYGKASNSTIGEKIYYAGIGSDGRIISFTGGSQAVMRVRGCVSCHGVDGKGEIPLMMTSKMATDITYASLINGKRESDEKEIPYTDKTIKLAITQGIDSSGKKLNIVMPRWNMSDRDLNELLMYLKEL